MMTEHTRATTVTGVGYPPKLAAETGPANSSAAAANTTSTTVGLVGRIKGAATRSIDPAAGAAPGCRRCCGCSACGGGEAGWVLRAKILRRAGRGRRATG